MPAVIQAWKLDPSSGPDGLLEPLRFHSTPKSLNAASQHLPGGIYTTLCTYSGGSHILPFDAQVRRLHESARLLGYSLDCDEALLRTAVRQAVSQHGAGDKRVRLTAALESTPVEVYITVEPLLAPSPAEYQQGVLVVTFPYQRETPRAKSTSFLPIAERLKAELPASANEGLLLDETGRILEGFSSNFFAIRNGQVFTSGDGILPGITREILITAARRIRLPVVFEGVHTSETSSLHEAFLTSASRGVLPVRQIDDQPVGPGSPGPLTLQLTAAFQHELETSLELL